MFDHRHMLPKVRQIRAHFVGLWPRLAHLNRKNKIVIKKEDKRLNQTVFKIKKVAANHKKINDKKDLNK